MSLENVECINDNVLESLGDAKILSGANYDLKTGTYDASCDRCDCVCHQSCHGEGPCYSM